MSAFVPLVASGNGELMGVQFHMRRREVVAKLPREGTIERNSGAQKTYPRSAGKLVQQMSILQTQR